MSATVDPEVMRRFERPPRAQLWRLPLHFALCVVFLYTASRGSGLPNVVFIVFASMQLLTLFTFMHGASHRHLSSSAVVNDVCGTILGILLGTSFSAYRHAHASHHRHLGTPRDPQESRIAFGKQHAPINRLSILCGAFFGAVIFLWVRVPLSGLRSASRRVVAAELLAAALFYGSLLSVLPELVLYPFVTMVIVTFVWGSLIDITYHQALGHDAYTSCSLECDLFGCVVLNGENRHAEHHEFPRIPSCNLAKLSKAIGLERRLSGVLYERGYCAALTRVARGLF